MLGWQPVIDEIAKIMTGILLIHLEDSRRRKRSQKCETSTLTYRELLEMMKSMPNYPVGSVMASKVGNQWACRAAAAA